jgi:hypothetical protein
MRPPTPLVLVLVLVLSPFVLCDNPVADAIANAEKNKGVLESEAAALKAQDDPAPPSAASLASLARTTGLARANQAQRDAQFDEGAEETEAYRARWTELMRSNAAPRPVPGPPVAPRKDVPGTTQRELVERERATLGNRNGAPKAPISRDERKRELDEQARREREAEELKAPGSEEMEEEKSVRPGEDATVADKDLIASIAAEDKAAQAQVPK